MIRLGRGLRSPMWSSELELGVIEDGGADYLEIHLLVWMEMGYELGGKEGGKKWFYMSSFSRKFRGGERH